MEHIKNWDKIPKPTEEEMVEFNKKFPEGDKKEDKWPGLMTMNSAEIYAKALNCTVEQFLTEYKKNPGGYW